MTDLISKQAVLDLIADYDLSMGQVVRGIHALQSVTPPEEELEEIKRELKELDVEPDGIHFWRANRHETINVVLHIIDNHIEELKGENK